MARVQKLLQIKKSDGCVVASLFEPVAIRSDNASLFERELLDCLEAGGEEPIILDLANVRYISSLGLGALLTLCRQSVPAGREVRVCGVSDQLMEVLQVCQLDRVVPLFDSVKAATSGK